MQFVRQLGGGLVYGILSLILVVGVLSLALAETHTSSNPSQATSSIPLVPSSTPTQPIPTAVGTQSAGGSPAIHAPPVCSPPIGWIRIIIEPGHTLLGLALAYRTTTAALAGANCLSTSSVMVGSGLYVPPLPTHTFSPCHPFPGWVAGYLVQPGDTLFHIALLYGTTVESLKFANCRVGNEIFPGERLWVPNVPVRTPGLTVIPDFGTPTEQPTLPLTLTPLPFTETAQPTMTDLPASDTATPTSTPVTATPTPY